MFEYETTQKFGQPLNIKVKMSNGRRFRHIGNIRATDGGYFYQPKGSKVRGDTFPTVREVKDSIEAE